MTQRNFDRQMWAIQRLSELDRWQQGNYEITEFVVEEWAGNSVNVKRLRIPLEKGKPMREGFGYHESYVIGPRGKVKEIYSSLY